MGPDDLEQLLARAEKETRPHVAYMHLDEARSLLQAPWVDARLFKRARDLFLHHGLTPPQPHLPELHIGESWLLLTAPGGRGTVVRLCLSRPGLDAGPIAAHEAKRAIAGLHAAAAAHGRHLPRPTVPDCFAILGGTPHVEVVGSSLGLPTVIAALSLALGQSPKSTVAGTAAVEMDGSLRPVAHLPAKVAALREQWPQVNTLVVAADQLGIGEVDPSIQIQRAPDISAACAHFGLSLDLLQPCRIDARLLQLAALEKEHAKAPPSAEWLTLSAAAWEIHRALEPVPACRTDAAKALLLAAIFASHAGDNQQAAALVARISEEDLHAHPVLHARRLIYQASIAIDDDPQPARAVASRAVAVCRALDAESQRRLLGMALGTEGRALLHGGDLTAAEPLLSEATAHHETHLPQEWPRSACYLATCIRRSARPAEALELARAALAQAVVDTKLWDSAETTLLYLHLECARCLAALGHIEDALLQLDQVVAGQPAAAAYPRLGAHRTLARILHRHGRQDEARQHLKTCIEVARAHHAPTLRKVGAIAAGEALLSQPLLLPKQDLEAAWAACFPPEADPQVIVARWIY